MWWPHALAMDAFVVTFSFKIDQTDGTNYGDGLAWAVTTDPRNTPTAQTALGASGGMLGFQGIANAVRAARGDSVPARRRGAGALLTARLLCTAPDPRAALALGRTRQSCPSSRPPAPSTSPRPRPRCRWASGSMATETALP